MKDVFAKRETNRRAAQSCALILCKLSLTLTAWTSADELVINEEEEPHSNEWNGLILFLSSLFV